LRPLEARRVNGISLKVARGPLRAISRHYSAWSDIFFPRVRRTSAEAAITRERISLPSSFSLSRISRFFSARRNLQRRTFSSRPPLAWRNRMRYFASRNYQCFFVNSFRRKERWKKLLKCGERSSKIKTRMTMTMPTTTLVILK